MVRAFAEKVLYLMGRDKFRLANFASEAVKASNANVLISTTATRTEGGWLLNGEKSFGCLSGTADYYLVTARREDVEGLDGAEPVPGRPRRPRASGRGHRWNGLGMRASDNNGLVLEDCFVPDDFALTVPGAFTRATQMSRGSWVGNQVAIAAIYAGIARGVWEYAFGRTMAAKFADTGKPIASSPMHQVLIGEAEEALAEAHLWLRRQIDLEASDPPILPKPAVVASWKLAKGAICEHVARGRRSTSLKMCGTSGALMDNVIGRAVRDTAMGLVQAFPAERGKLDLAKMMVDNDRVGRPHHAPTASGNDHVDRARHVGSGGVGAQSASGACPRSPSWSPAPGPRRATGSTWCWRTRTAARRLGVARRQRHVVGRRGTGRGRRGARRGRLVRPACRAPGRGARRGRRRARGVRCPGWRRSRPSPPASRSARPRSSG